MNKDNWLDRWLVKIRETTKELPLLELGCGQGADTEVLARNNINVIAVDRSQEAIKQARKNVPSAEFYCQDIREFFPNKAEKYNVIMASLSFHYFDWRSTQNLVARVYEKLNANGLFLFRVNSTNDINYGANSGEVIAPNFYKVKGQDKRFFDEKAIRELFKDNWKFHSQEENTIYRYEKAKVVWELMLEKQ